MPDQSKPKAFTPREGDVLRLIARGRTNQQISEELYLSVNSVKTLARRAYRTIGVTSRNEAIVWGISNGYVSDDAQQRRASHGSRGAQRGRPPAFEG